MKVELLIDGHKVPLFSTEIRNTAEKQQALIEEYQQVFCTPVGAKVLGHLAQVAMFDQPTFDPDARVEAQNEGMRRLFLSILRMLTRDPKQVVQKQTQEG